MGKPIDNISSSIQDLRDSLYNEIVSTCSEVANVSLEEIKSMQKGNAFWNNQTGEALDSIGAEVINNGDVINIKLGFKEGRPAEKRISGNREYDKYLAEYSGKGNMFLGQSLSTLTRNFAALIPDISFKAKKSHFNIKNNKWSFE